jgi:hypothetical protein
MMISHKPYPGSEFKPVLVRCDVSMKQLSHFMEFGFYHHILKGQVWARGSKVLNTDFRNFIDHGLDCLLSPYG